MITSLLRFGWRTVNSTLRRSHHALRFARKPIRVHPSTWVSWRSDVRVCGGGSISIGQNCEIHPLAMILTYGGDIQIGNDCSVNPCAIVYGHGGVKIGNSVRIAAHTVIIPANHNAPTGHVPLHLSGVSGHGIVIEDDVWLGAGCRILDGVRIGKGAIVGAGSVVTKSVAANTTVAGFPPV